MPSVEERVAFLEGRIGEHGHMIGGVREAVVDLDRRVDGRFQEVDRRFDRIERRFDGVDRKLWWLMGIPVSGLTAVVTALLSHH